MGDAILAGTSPICLNITIIDRISQFERMFGILQGGICMESKKEEYRQKIIDVINRIDSESILKYIYSVISSYLKSRGL